MAKKIAGKDRPYTFYEFFREVEKIAKEKNVEFLDNLEYFNDAGWYGEKNEITDSDVLIVSRTNYGGSEGIYSSFYLLRAGEETRIFIAKTLRTDDEAYISMHIFAAKICLIANKFISSHEDEFNWRGFDIKLTKNGKNYGGWWCPTCESAEAKVREISAEEPDVTFSVRDNATRKFLKF